MNKQAEYIDRKESWIASIILGIFFVWILDFAMIISNGEFTAAILNMLMGNDYVLSDITNGLLLMGFSIIALRIFFHIAIKQKW